VPGVETAREHAACAAGLEPVYEAQAALTPVLNRTPLRAAARLSRRYGLHVWLKLENVQPTGSFKVRPALFGLRRNLHLARERGVIASSSGNFGKAVAWAARMHGIDAEIVVQAGASGRKVADAEALGARVVRCGASYHERLAMTLARQQASGRVLLHSSDSVETVAANAVIGLELVDEVEDCFTVVAPVSGGGLLGGIAWSVRTLRPRWDVAGVQAAANPSMAVSLGRGVPVTVTPGPTLADALLVSCPSAISFSYVRQYADGVELVEECAISSAVALLAGEEGVAAEPGGAAGVALLEAGWRPRNGRSVIVVISGGNA
jgi:threonine dehydratase